MNENEKQVKRDTSQNLVIDANGNRNFPKKVPTETCNGKIHRQFRYCAKPAGWGTDHKGMGRCKLHGGCATGPKSGNLRYSDFVPSDLIEKYEEFSVEPVKDMKSLDDEIAMVRAKIACYIKVNQNGEYDKSVATYTELLRRLIDTKQRVEEGTKVKVSVDIAVKIIDAVIKIIDTSIENPKIKCEIATRMRGLNFSHLGIL